MGQLRRMRRRGRSGDNVTRIREAGTAGLADEQRARTGKATAAGQLRDVDSRATRDYDRDHCSAVSSEAASEATGAARPRRVREKGELAGMNPAGSQEAS